MWLYRRMLRMPRTAQVSNNEVLNRYARDGGALRSQTVKASIFWPCSPQQKLPSSAAGYGGKD